MLQVHREVCARIPTPLGEFRLCLYTNDLDDKEHLALIMGEVVGREDVLVRVHSECLTGDLLGSQRCDCGEQLDRSLEAIAAEGRGVLVYLRQEGRGIGLLDKLHAYNLQDQGFDTVDANLLLGHQADERDFTAAPLILGDLEIRSVRLLTNNPDKIAALRALGVPVSDRVGLAAAVNPENARYLRTKVLRMNHLMNLGLPGQNGRPGEATGNREEPSRGDEP
ncbi:MAG TPA: GTP cyclohydrolase II [Anaerolineales bacterium]|nr:GTP cyclohydrolase II [Anaerolineales bacterium]